MDDEMYGDDNMAIGDEYEEMNTITTHDDVRKKLTYFI